MSKNIIGAEGLSSVAVAFAMLAMPCVSWASNAACSTTATIGSFGAQATNVGCWETDQTFSNFSIPAGSSGSQSTSTVDITGSETGTYPAVSPGWTVNAQFAGTSTWTETGNGGATFSGGADYLANLGQSQMAIGSGYVAPTGSDFFTYLSASLDASGSTGNNAADTMSVTEEICIGNSTCTATNSVTLTATWSGSGVTTATLGCSVGSGVTADFACSGSTANFKVAVPTLTVDNSFNMVVHGSGGGTTSTDSLASFTDAFIDQQAPAPEPSTFVLLGSALVGLGLAFRRKSHVL